MKKLLFFALLSTLFLSACRQFDDLSEASVSDYEAEFAIPLISSSISLETLLDKLDSFTFAEVDPDGLIRLRYRGQVVTRTSQDIFNSIASALPPGIPVIDTVMILPFSTPDGMSIDYVRIKKGVLQYFFRSNHTQNVQVKVRFPQAFSPSGQPVEFTHNLNYTGSVPVNIFPVQLDMKNYTLEAEDGNIYIEYEAIKADGTRDTVSDFFIFFNGLEFSYAEGYFGNQTHENGRDTIKIDFFETWTQGNVTFEDPRIYINVFNSFGVPTRSVAKIFQIQTADGQILPLESPYIDSGIDFVFPTFDEIGQEKTTSFSFTKDNSNIDVILGSNPVALDYDVDAITNPDSDVAVRGYITDSSSYTVFVEVDLPIHGRANGYLVRDTFDLNFERFDRVRAVEFKLITENGLPLGVDVQAYFIGPDGEVLDVLLDEPQTLLEAAPVNAEGVATSTIKTITLIPFDAERFDRVRNANKLILNAWFSTTNEGSVPVKIFKQQELGIRMGMRVETGN
jgi:hypothetical protein